MKACYILHEPKNNFDEQYESFFIRHKYSHLTICLHLMEPHSWTDGETFVFKKSPRSTTRRRWAWRRWRRNFAATSIPAASTKSISSLPGAPARAPRPSGVCSRLKTVRYSGDNVINNLELGSGGGTSGRGMAFCLGRPGSNPGTDFGFFSSQNCCQSVLTGCWAFSNNV